MATVLLSLLITISNISFADSRDTKRENCFYNGKRLNVSIPNDTPQEVTKVPEDFSGDVMCVRIPEGTKQEEFTLKKGKRTGLFRKYDSDGRLSEQMEYKDDLRHGIFKRYDHRNGKLQQEYNYVNDENVGIQKEYDSDSGVIERLYWTPSDTSIQFNKKGQPTTITCGKHSVIAEDNYWCGRNGKRGKVTLYNSEGKVTETREFLNDKQDGKTVVYMSEGKTEEKIYKDDQLVKSEFKSGGKVIASENFKGGIRDGIEKVLFESTNKPHIIVSWKKGQKMSEKVFYENGNPKSETHFLKGGKLTYKSYYENGKVHTEGTYILKFLWFWSFDVPHGSVSYYDYDGKLKEVLNYQNGHLHGDVKYFHEGSVWRLEKYDKGILLSAEEYAGKKVIRKTEYNKDGTIKKQIEPSTTV